MIAAPKMQRRKPDESRPSGRGPPAKALPSRGGASQHNVPVREIQSSIGWPAFKWRSVLAVVMLALALQIAQWVLPGHRFSQKFHLKPLKLPYVTSSALFTDRYLEDMYWGTYRPGMYCGIRGREPQSLVAGVMWSLATMQSWQHIRHAARGEDRLQEFGWNRHNLRSYGEQNITDGVVKLTTQFLKQPSAGYGGDWALRVNVTGTGSQDTRERVSLYFYIGDERGPASKNAMWDDVRLPKLKALRSSQGVKLASGTAGKVGPWQLRARAWLGSDSAASVTAIKIPAPEFHDMHSPVQAQIAARARGQVAAGHKPDFIMSSAEVPGANVIVMQVQAALPFSLDYVFMSGTDQAADKSSVRFSNLSHTSLTKKLRNERALFDVRFESIFKRQPVNPDEIAFSKAALSESLGSMGYFYGSSDVQMPGQSDPPVIKQTQPVPLFTAVPSRSFFPRGFLWDEGFHQLLIQQWDLLASCDVLAHWLDLMNEDGWIPREQILGSEARSRVPAEFVSQHPTHANPPTLFLPFMRLALAANSTEDDLIPPSIPKHQILDFLTLAWPRLVRWYSWFELTQAGPVPGSFRWRGRVADSDVELNPKTLASGLDDYPRASHPSDAERHTDLRCWMAFMSQAMADIGEVIGSGGRELERLQTAARTLGELEGLKSLHWDSKTGMFLDWGLHTEDVVLTRVRRGDEMVTVRNSTGAPPTLQHVPHFGYNSLFPLALQLLPSDSLELGVQLQHLRAPGLLWTPFGLRSLSKSSSLYQAYNTGTDPPYWRGAIWINLNFLVLRSLHKCARELGPHRQACADAYSDLRKNVMANMVKQFLKPTEPFIWEQYDDVTGVGRGQRPFGWSSLGALIAAEKF